MSMKLVEDPTCKGPRMSSRQSYKRGVMEARLKSAPGHGVVTSAIWQSTPLEVADELDWEFRGKNGLESSVDSNIYVDGRMGGKCEVCVCL